MPWLDIIIVGVIAWFAISGYFRGLISEALTLAGWVLGFYWGGQYRGVVAPYLSFLPPGLASAAAFILIVGAVSTIAFLASIFLRRVTRLLFLGWLDHLGGAAFGLVKAMVILGVGLLILNNLPFLDGKVVGQSSLALYFLNYFPALLSLLSIDLSDLLRFTSSFPN